MVFKIVDGTTTTTGGVPIFNTTYGKAYFDKEFDHVFVFMEYIGYLRRKLGEPRLIHTVRGVGYALRER